MVKRLAILSVVTLFGIAIMSAAAKSPQGKSPLTGSATAIGNPVTPTAASQAKAKEIYGYDCSVCHGVTGDGNTSLGHQVGWSIPDLTNPMTMSGATDRNLYDIIWNGKGKMPGESGRATPDEVRNLVAYIRGLSDKKLPIEQKQTAQ